MLGPVLFYSVFEAELDFDLVFTRFCGDLNVFWVRRFFVILLSIVTCLVILDQEDWVSPRSRVGNFGMCETLGEESDEFYCISILF